MKKIYLRVFGVRVRGRKLLKYIFNATLHSAIALRYVRLKKGQWH